MSNEIKHVPVSNMRMYTAARLRQMKGPEIICVHSEPLAVMVPIALYHHWQQLRDIIGSATFDTRPDLHALLADLHFRMLVSEGAPEDEACRCARPAPLVPGAKCRRCHRWTVAAVNEATGEMTTVPSRQE